MTESEIKTRVRARDGYRCRDCGMSEAQHLETHGSKLEIHRLIPGSIYSLEYCVTLCRTCHHKKPRRPEDLIFTNGHGHEVSGLQVVMFNLYDPDTKRLLSLLREKAEALDMSLSGLIAHVLTEYVDGIAPDYRI